jgi:RNA 2',3'-cyclic 3'-phosphodiesterase
VPPEARSSIDAQLAPYRRRHAEVRWLPPGSWHLTLLFLGAVAPTRVAELAALVDGVAQVAPAFAAQVEGGSGRMSDRHGVAWLRLGPGARELIALADRLATDCPADVTLSGPPRRTPSAHLTVARRADDAVVADLREERLGRLRVAWTVDSIALLRSHLDRDGARYDTLHEAALYAPAG